MFNTAVLQVQSGYEQRIPNWTDPRAEYSATLLASNDSTFANALALIDALRTFFLMVGGRGDGFRFYDELNSEASNEPMGMIDATHWQLQKTFSLAGQSYIRTITKPIGPGAIDYQGSALSETVVVNPAGGTLSSLDHTTGIATFSVAPTGVPTASFEYHIPVRFTADKFEPEIQRSAQGSRLIKWNLGLIEVLPPNY